MYRLFDLMIAVCFIVVNGKYLLIPGLVLLPSILNINHRNSNRRNCSGPWCCADSSCSLCCIWRCCYIYRWRYICRRMTLRGLQVPSWRKSSCDSWWLWLCLPFSAFSLRHFRCAVGLIWRTSYWLKCTVYWRVVNGLINVIALKHDSQDWQRCL